MSLPQPEIEREIDRSAKGGASSDNGTVTVAHVRDLTPDAENRRAHNPRNIGMIVDSLHHVGAARSIVIDEDGVVLCGNDHAPADGEMPLGGGAADDGSDDGSNPQSGTSQGKTS